MDLKSIWKKIVAAAGIIIFIWLVIPIPEISIVVGLLGGKALTLYIPPWMAYLASFVGALVGWLIIRRLDLLQKIRRLTRG